MVKKIFLFMVVIAGLFAQDVKILIPEGIYRCVYDAEANADWTVKRKLNQVSVDVLIFRGSDKPIQDNNFFLKKVKVTKDIVHYYNEEKFMGMHIVNRKVKVGGVLGVGVENVVSGLKFIGFCVYLGKYWKDRFLRSFSIYQKMEYSRNDIDIFSKSCIYKLFFSF